MGTIFVIGIIFSINNSTLKGSIYILRRKETKGGREEEGREGGRKGERKMDPTFLWVFLLVFQKKFYV